MAMFFFGKRDKRNHVEALVRRILNRTTPNQVPPGGEARCENRYNRSIPLIVGPWDGEGVSADECVYTVTKDLSEHGLGIVLDQPWRDRNVVLCFWDEGPHFILAEVCQNTLLGRRRWQVGLQLQEVIDVAEYPRLEAIASHAPQLQA